MKVPSYGSLIFPLSALTFSLLSLFIVIIVIPGFFIWIGLKLLGKDIGIIKAGFANFVAVIFTSVITYLLFSTPLFLLSPLISFIAYFYALKSLLDISFIEAFAATIIASIVILAIFAVAVLFFAVPLPRLHIHF